MSWVEIKGLNERKAALVAKMQAMVKVAKDENRDLTNAEEAEFTSHETSAAVINKQIESHGRVEAVRAHPGNSNPVGNGSLAPTSNENAGSRVRTGRIDYGMETRAAQMFPADPAYQNLDRPLSLGKLVKGMITGSWKDADLESRALSIGTSSAGGVLVPTPLWNDVIDFARNTAVCFKAGCRIIPMEKQTLKLARLTGDVGSGWVAENAAISETDSTFDSVTLSAKKVACLVKMSVEIAEDADGIDAVVNNSIGKSLALALDGAILYGSGSSSQPLGISGQSGIGTQTAVGSPTDYSAWSKAIQAVRQANFEPTAQLNSPRTAGHMERLVDTLGQPMRLPMSVQNLPGFITNQIPINSGGGANESQSFVGDFTQCLVGMRQQMYLEVSRQAGDSSTSAFTNGQVWVRAYLRADVQLAHPLAFVYMSGITGT